MNGGATSLAQPTLPQSSSATFDFFKEVVERMDNHEGELSKEVVLNVFMMAALSQPDAIRNDILRYIKEKPSTFLTRLKKRTPEDTSAFVQVATDVSGALIAFSIRKKGVMYVRKSLEFAAEFLPGGTITRKIIVGGVLFSAEFLIETIKNACLNFERKPSSGVLQLMNRGWTISIHAASNTFGNLNRFVPFKRVRKSPKEAIMLDARAQSPIDSVLVLTTPSPVFILSTIPRNPSSSVRIEEIKEASEEKKPPQLVNKR